MKNLVLASTSKYRKELLENLHWPFETMAPEVDENIYKNDHLSPQELAEKLSFLKAQNVLLKKKEAVVIGSDQVCSLDKMIFSKPKNAKSAFDQLKTLSGQKHQLLTSVTIMSSSQSLTWTNSTTLFMRKLEDKDILRYLQVDSPFDCAGSYKLESMGIKLFEKIEMSDHTAIIGLPLMEITNVLISQFGFEF